MTQAEVKKLASEIIGDGQTPNQWFVTLSPYIRVENEDDCALIEGYNEKDAYTHGPFDNYEDAVDCLDDQELDIKYGVGSVSIEDRQCGTVYEKWLTKKVKVVYEEDSHDDSRLFYKS
ncbi:MAG: hypothetical protein EBU33_10905 [Sphingobacteriia bacterium]|nr:hypothetical protein [Sphingobacteriia bacterium]